MNKLDEAILAALYPLRKQVSTAYLCDQIRLKMRVTPAVLEERVKALEQDGFLRTGRAGRGTVLVLLTRAGTDYAARALDPVLGAIRAIGLVVLGGIMLICFMGLTSGHVPWLIPFTSVGKRLAGPTVVAAVNTVRAAGQPTETPMPTATPAPIWTITAVPQALIEAAGPELLSDLNVNDSIFIPQIQPAVSPANAGFNQAVQDYARAQQYGPRQWLGGLLPAPGGSLYVDYVLLSRADWTAGENFPYFDGSAPATTLQQATLNGNHAVLSVLFQADSFFGGAHPATTYETINWDFTTGRPLSLGDLFLPNSPYLAVISNYGQIPSADPQYYQAWGITSRGLVIVFGECEMGPCVGGAKFFLVPYEVIGGMIDPRGPLGRYAR